MQYLAAMSLPLFFYDGALIPQSHISLHEDTAKHVVQVLRMNVGECLKLTNGKGLAAEVVITETAKKKCTVQVGQVREYLPHHTNLHLAVAFTKNTARNEWLLEKATELGARSIIPIVATRTEREHIRYDRWNNILIAAMMQSQQYHLPILPEATNLSQIIKTHNDVPQKFIAHCIDGIDKLPLSELMQANKDTMILIGPEGDFTKEEVSLCLNNGYIGIDLGKQRLRTETAAMAACAYFNLINHEA